MVRKIVIYLFLFCLILIFFTLNIITLNEFYGDGAPYFNRKVNMDKWQNPLPRLLVLDVMLIMVFLFLFRMLKKKVNV